MFTVVVQNWWNLKNNLLLGTDLSASNHGQLSIKPSTETELKLNMGLLLRGLVSCTKKFESRSKNGAGVWGKWEIRFSFPFLEDEKTRREPSGREGRESRETQWKTKRQADTLIVPLHLDYSLALSPSSFLCYSLALVAFLIPIILCAEHRAYL
ncbi:hypothetical protein R6Q59_025828 [Mikania micrantha]